MDIEAHECRAVLGSPGIFSDPRFDIIAISIEWNYVSNGKISDLCPLPKLKSFVQLLVQNSFEPTDYRQGCQMATFDPFLSLDCAGVEGGGSAIQDKEGIKFCSAA